MGLDSSLDKPVQTLEEALAPGGREHIALVGGGGKTTLLFALANELARRGRRVITSTTTKIWFREAQRAPQVILVERNPEWRGELNGAVQRHGQAFLGRSLLDSGKVEGIARDLADEIYQDKEGIDYLILEGDGAAGHPVKAPALHEPVIPATATTVIAMLGLEAMWQRADPEVVFRLDAFEEITGTRPGHTLTPETLSRVFLNPEGMFKGRPPGARRTVFLNKIDLMNDERGAKDLASILLRGGPENIDRVVIGSLLEERYRVREADNEGDL